MPPVRFVSVGFLATGLLAASPTLAESQVRVPKWEVEVHGSFATPSAAPAGVDRVPGPGPVFTLGDGVTPSRAVPSWYFGHGASLLNQVLALRGVPERLTPLDSGDWPSAGRRPGAQAGARIARRVTNTVWLEFTADLGLDPLGFDADAKARIEETRASFVTAFTALNNSTPTLTANPAISSTATVVSGGRRLVATGVVHYRGTGTGIRPYVLAGGGFATPIGRATSVELVGNYQLTTPGAAMFDETDTMVLRYRTARSLVMVAGFGFMRDVSPRSGYRVETRVMFGPSRLEAVLDTEAAIRVTTPTGAAILNSTSPGLQFSTNGLRTNLSGQPIHEFMALTAESRTMQWVISAGYYWRF